MLPRVFAKGLVAAGLYAALLGATGAVAQDPTPSGSPEQTATPAQTETATPTQTSEPTPESTGTPESTPTNTPDSTPESTPESTPSATATPEATVMATPTSQAGESAKGEDIDFEASVDVGEFVLDLDDEALDASGTDESLPFCPTPAQARALAKKLAKKNRKAGKKTSSSDRGLECRPRKSKKPRVKIRNSDGTPTLDNPGITLATPGAAPIGVPNFMIDKFRIPPFLLPIYQAAGIQYGIRWEILAGINEIETDYGRNLNVSSAGALGWMQFMPATWKMYGVDANKDGLKDPYNPVDAIFAAARYLRAAGGQTDIRKGIFAYNHADWYVDSVLMRARLIGGLPSNFVGSLTGLTQARFPVFAKATYAGDLDEKDAKRKVKTGENAAFAVESQQGRRGIQVFARRGAPVIAVNDGKIVNIGQSKRLGHFIQLQDSYGNVFTYAHLGSVAQTYPAPRPRKVTKKDIAKVMAEPEADKEPTDAASALTKEQANDDGDDTTAAEDAIEDVIPAAEVKTVLPAKTRLSANSAHPAVDPLAVEAAKERLYANPQRPMARAAGGELQLAEADYKPSANAPLKLNKRDYQAKKMKEGVRVIAGTILGRIGKTSAKKAPHVLFEIRPAGRGAPRIDPKPILDGWKLLESTEIYRAAGKNAFFGPDSRNASIGQILLMGKDALAQRVLNNPRIEVYGCGRQDIRVGSIDRRVLATLEFLAASGLKPTITSLKCGHGFYTASGNVSQHSSGNAVDIAAVNGIPIIGHQGEDSITELTIQRLLTLQGNMKPDQIISLMTFEGADNTLAMADHHDHIHVGFQPMYGTNSKAAKQVNAVLKPRQWIKLIDRLGEIDNPTVRLKPSKYALKVAKKVSASGSSAAHRGE
jgi:hypothetical protein